MTYSVKFIIKDNTPIVKSYNWKVDGEFSDFLDRNIDDITGHGHIITNIYCKRDEKPKNINPD